MQTQVERAKENEQERPPAIQLSLPLSGHTKNRIW
jgi:hypothetical protein